MIKKEKNLFNKERVIDFLEIQNLRSILNIDLSVPDYSIETNLFKKIIRDINKQTKAKRTINPIIMKIA